MVIIRLHTDAKDENNIGSRYNAIGKEKFAQRILEPPVLPLQEQVRSLPKPATATVDVKDKLKLILSQLKKLLDYPVRTLQNKDKVSVNKSVIEFNNPITGSFKNESHNSGGSGSFDAEDGGLNFSEPLLNSPNRALSIQQVSSEHLALIVDGEYLLKIFGDGDAERLFVMLAKLCKSVIACRVSPEQKRLLVRLIKRGVSPQPITLAIGGRNLPDFIYNTGEFILLSLYLFCRWGK